MSTFTISGLWKEKLYDFAIGMGQTAVPLCISRNKIKIKSRAPTGVFRPFYNNL
jgi:hypothetical protein